eukprot:CAMPEP_0195522374 /NCGR_PEP_ID=MMETSP0794_2-20130614/20507_1 /TAXON_ID=515487 /ORGANISM="Stephanopyxis turris, Strain CCMP 815" /LENGTH=722 /DNA_ID=CAMNT_0040652123 /DNA_START=33 /DNA_END=2201 /DNA_ORIENTATION=+
MTVVTGEKLSDTMNPPASLSKNSNDWSSIAIKLCISNQGNLVRRIPVPRLIPPGHSVPSIVKLKRMSVLFYFEQQQQGGSLYHKVAIAKEEYEGNKQDYLDKFHVWFTYRDEENDAIIFSSNVELEEALQLSSSSSVHNSHIRFLRVTADVQPLILYASKEEALQRNNKPMLTTKQHDTKMQNIETSKIETPEEKRPSSSPLTSLPKYDPNFVHARHACDLCHVQPIVGFRWHAHITTTRATTLLSESMFKKYCNFDLCHSCFIRWREEIDEAQDECTSGEDFIVAKEVKFHPVQYERDSKFVVPPNNISLQMRRLANIFTQYKQNHDDNNSSSNDIPELETKSPSRPYTISIVECPGVNEGIQKSLQELHRKNYCHAEKKKVDEQKEKKEMTAVVMQSSITCESDNTETTTDCTADCNDDEHHYSERSESNEEAKEEKEEDVETQSARGASCFSVDSEINNIAPLQSVLLPSNNAQMMIDYPPMTTTNQKECNEEKSLEPLSSSNIQSNESVKKDEKTTQGEENAALKLSTSTGNNESALMLSDSSISALTLPSERTNHEKKDGKNHEENRNATDVDADMDNYVSPSSQQSQREQGENYCYNDTDLSHASNITLESCSLFLLPPPDDLHPKEQQNMESSCSLRKCVEEGKYDTTAPDVNVSCHDAAFYPISMDPPNSASGSISSGHKISDVEWDEECCCNNDDIILLTEDKADPDDASWKD